MIKITNNTNNPDTNIEKFIVSEIEKALLTIKQFTTTKEWMSLKDGASYMGVSYNTFKKYPMKGLKICEIDGIKRVSRKEIDKFLENLSY